MLRSTNSNNISSSDLLSWPVALSTNDSSSDDDSLADTYQTQNLQMQNYTASDDETIPSALQTEYVLHSSESSNLTQTQLGYSEVGNTGNTQKRQKRKQSQLSEALDDCNLSDNSIMIPVQNSGQDPVADIVANPPSPHQRLPQPLLSLDTKHVPNNPLASINTASSAPSTPPSEHSTFFTVNTCNNSPQLSKTLTYSTTNESEPLSPIKHKYSPVWFSSKYPSTSNKQPSVSVSLSESAPKNLENPVKDTIVNLRSSSICSTKSTPAETTQCFNSSKPVSKKRITSLPSSQQQQQLKNKSQHSHSSSRSSTYSEQTNTGSEFSNLTNLVTSVPALKLKPTSSPSILINSNSSTNIVSSKSLNHLPKYSGANKPLFEKPLPVTPTFPIGNSYPLTPPETVDNSQAFLEQPPVITSLVTPVAPIPTRPLSLTLAYKTNSPGGEALDLSKYNNRYSCSEIMMMEARLEQMKTSSSELFPPTPTELMSTSSFSGTAVPPKFFPSRQPVISPDSPNDGVGLRAVTKLDNINYNSNILSNDNNNSNNTASVQKKPEKNSTATTSKRFSFLWRKRKSKTAVPEEAIEPAKLDIGKSIAVDKTPNTPTTATNTTTNEILTATAESNQHEKSPAVEMFFDGSSPSTVVPTSQKQQQESFESPSTALIVSTPESVLPIQPRSRLEDKTVRKSLSYELDDEVEKRASQEAMNNNSNITNTTTTTTMESPTEDTAETTGITENASSEKLMLNKNFIQKPGFTVHRSNSSLRTAQPPPSLPLSTASATAPILPSPIKSSSSSLPSSATSNINQRRLSIAPSLARNSLISQYSPVIEHATEVTVSQPNSTSPDNNSVTLPPYRRASISEVTVQGPRSRPASTANDSVSVSRKSSIVVIENSRRSTNEMESVLSDMKALRKVSIKGKKTKTDPQQDENEQIKPSTLLATTSSSAVTPSVEPSVSKKLPDKSTSSKHSKGLSDNSRDKKLPPMPVPFDFTPDENTSPQRLPRSMEYQSDVSTNTTTVLNTAWGPAKMLSPVPGSAGSSAVNFPIEPKVSAKPGMKHTHSRINLHETGFISTDETNSNSVNELEVVKRNRRFTHPTASTSVKSPSFSTDEVFATAPNSPEVQLSHRILAGYAADNEKILPPEPPFAGSTNPDTANSSNESFLSARSQNETSSDENRTAVLGSNSKLQLPAGLQSPFMGLPSNATTAGKGGLTNLMMKARQHQKRLAARSVSSPLTATSFPSSMSPSEPRTKQPLNNHRQSVQKKSAAKNGFNARFDDDDSDRFAHAQEDEAPATGETMVAPLEPVGPRSKAAPEESKIFYESNASVSQSSSDGENIDIRRRVGRRSRTASNPERLSARQKRSSQRLTQLSRDPIVTPNAATGDNHHHHRGGGKSRSRRHHHHDDAKKHETRHRIPFDTPSVQQLLDLSRDTFKLRDLDIPPTERVLIEKFVDSLARLSADIATDTKKRPEGIRRLHNALRAIEGWI